MEGGGHCHEVHVIGVHLCLEKQICHVQLAPDFALGAVGQYVVDAWQGMGVQYRIRIKYAIVIYPTG